MLFTIFLVKVYTFRISSYFYDRFNIMYFTIINSNHNYN